MIFRHKADLHGTARSLSTDLWSTTRLLLREDGAGLTVTDVVLAPGVEAPYGYDHHLEICYCLEGDATLTVETTGEVRRVEPGFLWVCFPGERFRFIAHVPTRLISIFNPALVGPEVNDETGSFPAA